MRCGTLFLLVVVAGLLFWPQPAHAAAWFDVAGNIAESIHQWFCEGVLDGAAWFFNGYNAILDGISGEGMLTRPFESLLGDDAYGFIDSIHSTVVIPIAEGILALSLLTQLIKISQRIDATSTLPALKDIVFLAVTYVLLHWFILNSLAVMNDIYSIIADRIIPGITNVIGSNDTHSYFDGIVSVDGIEDWSQVSVGACLMVLFFSILSLSGGVLAFIVTFVVSFARAWQIYVYAVFSSIPVALLGFDETKQMGISFLKNFAAAALAGAIMVFLLGLYPYALSYVASGSAALGDATAIGGTIGGAMIQAVTGTLGGLIPALLVLLEFLGVTVVLIAGLFKSGSWAKEVLGG